MMYEKYELVGGSHKLEPKIIFLLVVSLRVIGVGCTRESHISLGSHLHLDTE